ncbi:pleiotropic drug resistance protein 3-like isoform X2 [Cornus florida]|uniref:pleiotropic drug resistance protein 3-like isoform X2 n=1 Tax=Cornus florida TaxID=4283 RepID=UPI0028994BE6|nr:pleiotropic drug resistance protein 3-like isoform X2 [Cornus florida]
MSLFDDDDGENSINGKQGKTVKDVTKLCPLQRQVFMEKLINHVEVDNGRLLLKMRERMDKVGVKLPTVEVRFMNLCVEAQCQVVHGKPLPTLWNSLKSIFSIFVKVPFCKPEEAKISITKGASGIIKPSRMTLLLGPPGCGKTTLLKALAGKLDKSLKVTGEISYNGCRPDNNLTTQKTTAYISQYDLLIPEMTVRETIDFSARCQGVESRTGIMVEISQREKHAGIIPDPDIDTYMKAISISGLEKNLQTDYTLKILGLDICADTLVGDVMRRGISGGQKRRLATGEMIVSPKRAFFMDEISNGLDSSTTFQIVTCLQQLVHVTDVTALISLLQPAPETFDLFDDIILFAEGKIVYHGPRADILKFFEDCGFRCPERKGVAEFLQEVISIKDQEHYWYSIELPYRYITVDEFSEKFKASHIGQRLDEELSKTFDNFQSQQIFLSPSNDSKYSVTRWELFKACIDREVLLMRRNSSVHVFKLAQLVIVALITMTVYLRTRMDVDLKHSNYFMGSLFYGIIRILTNGVEELFMTVSRLAVFYKQRDFNFYPAWAYAIPASLLKIPFSLVESFTWTALTYYVIGYSPEVERFLCQFLLFFALHQASIALFRFLASICQTEMAAIFSCNISILFMLLLGGFIIPQSSLPPWLWWGFWTCPLSYAEIGVSINEFLAPRWEKVTSGNLTVGQETLSRHGVNFKAYFYWISLGALFGFAIVFNIGFTLALTYLKSPATSRAIISYEKLCQLQQDEDFFVTTSISEDAARMVLPFEPMTLTFERVQYFVDTPLEMRRQGFTDRRLQLLHDMTGAFRPGILTALMGVSGAGKTTLMDVLAGRKISGSTEGDIRIGGFPKVQETFARISGYCEQTDIHSPQITVEESVIFSAWLRLPPQIDTQIRTEFIMDVLGRVELDAIKDALVGIPGISGLSNEQRKRLTIAVELISNPSVIFMDEPTSGLDARAAAIVMRAVKNVVDTGRTVVCTIHQPSIDIFEAFDELILMKKGGQIIYSGPLGQHSSNLIDYFEGIPGIPKIKKNYNPATWMLDITTESVEAQIGVNFAQVYKESQQYRENTELIKQLRKPPAGTRKMHFPTRFARNSWEQYKACLWKQNLSYWRSPAYNFTRFSFMIISSVFLGVLMWQKGMKIHDEQGMLNIISSLSMVLQLLGTSNCSSVIPVVSREQSVLYREKFSGMYSSWAYSFAQVTIEFPYILVQAVLFVIITYPAIGFYWSVDKVVRYFYATFCTLLYYTYLGMLVVSLSPNAKVASILATASYTILNLFSGFLIPEPALPKWWVWCYWISPTSWSLNAIITSQYGNIRQEITAFGERKAINSFLQDYFGYYQDRLGVVTVILTIFPLLFASLFAYSVGKLNFQRR